MKFVFCDEQQGVLDRGKFECITACVFDSECMRDFRSEFIARVVGILNIPEKTVVQPPKLHGSSMPDDLSRDQRSSIYVLTCELIAEYMVDIFRVGYFEKSLKDLSSGALDLSLFGLQFPIQSCYNDDMLYVYELNISAHQRIARNWNDTSHHFMFHQIGYNVSSVMNYEKIIGKLYADKENFFMYTADIISYLIYQKEKGATTEFKMGILKKFDVVIPQIKYNEIVWMNDPRRTSERNGT